MAGSLQELSPGSRHHDAARISVSRSSRTSRLPAFLPARAIADAEAAARSSIACDDRHTACACPIGGERFFQPGEEGETHVSLIYQFCRQ
jgi:hypothetical protein